MAAQAEAVCQLPKHWGELSGTAGETLHVSKRPGFAAGLVLEPS